MPYMPLFGCKGLMQRLGKSLALSRGALRRPKRAITVNAFPPFPLLLFIRTKRVSQ
jgi:hypothetical protein